VKRLRGALEGLGASRRELLVLAGAMAVSFAIVVVYVIARRHAALVGDQPEYDLQGHFFEMGKWWWSTTPFGIAHPTAWKAPGYPAWVGFWYSILGSSHVRVELVQALLAPLTVGLTWLLARRLFTPRVALAAACVVAVFPLAWEFYGLLYPEALAIPLTVLLLLLFLGRDPTPALAAGVGALLGLGMLVRPTSVFLGAGVAAAWIVAAGWRRGAAMTALSALCAILVIVPWTVRNAIEADGFIPISVQDGALAGTFNPTSANDPVYPYAWRPDAPIELALARGEPLGDAELRSKLQSAGWDYISEHPDSVPKAFFWNGLSRFWDVRRPGRALDETPFEGRVEAVTAVGLGMYYVLLPLAVVGLWRLRRRAEILFPVVSLALAASIVFTVASGTRYRATLEPLIVVLACSVLVPLRPRHRDGEPTPTPPAEAGI
jgi:4-amino-4-deoxy-L-arabinose transferase-like glycosyltransferase